MFKIKHTQFVGVMSGLFLASLLSACGGGDSDDEAGGDGTPSVSTTVRGVAMAGPFSSGQVCAYPVSANGVGTEALACGQIDPASSQFTLNVQGYVGEALLSLLAGAVYDDEATPGVDATTLTVPLRTLVSVNGGEISVALTPFTEAALRMADQMSSAAAQAAAEELAQTFGMGSGFDFFDVLPAMISTTASQETYRQALAVLSGLQSMAGVSLDAYLAQVAAADPSAYAEQVGNYINAYLPDHCSYANNTFTCDLPGNGDGNGGGDDNGGGIPSGDYDLTVTVSGNFPVQPPAVVINDIPKPTTQDEFCNDPTAMEQLDALNNGYSGATVTITGCTFSGNTGRVDVQINITSPISMSFAYSAHYLYTPN